MSDDQRASTAITMLAVVGVVTLAVVVGITYGPALLSGDDFSSYGPAATHNSSYDSGAEQFTITIVEGSYVNKKGDWTVKRVVVTQAAGPDGTHKVPVTVRNGSTSSTAGVWYTANGTGVSAERPRTGDSVTIVADATDLDDDGDAGPEPGEAYRIVAHGEEHTAVMTKKVVPGSETRVYAPTPTATATNSTS
jgi:hypothetical protein